MCRLRSHEGHVPNRPTVQIRVTYRRHLPKRGKLTTALGRDILKTRNVVDVTVWLKRHCQVEVVPSGVLEACFQPEVLQLQKFTAPRRLPIPSRIEQCKNAAVKKNGKLKPSQTIQHATDARTHKSAVSSKCSRPS